MLHCFCFTSDLRYGYSLYFCRPIGYYYEDDDEYDMKTMYVGDEEKEMEERVRHAQAHMYIPGANRDE